MAYASRYYDRNGEPIPRNLWAKYFEDPTHRRVAQTTLPDGKWVSTVWLGLDHNYGDGPPLIFESMVLKSEAELDEIECDRYTTEDEARAGHEALVAKWSDPASAPERSEASS